MLRPLTNTEQPFRFVALTEHDQRTLYAAFQSRLFSQYRREEWIEELSAVVVKLQGALAQALVAKGASECAAQQSSSLRFTFCT